MATSSTEYLTARVPRMPMIVSVDLTRVCGGSLARTTLPVSVF